MLRRRRDSIGAGVIPKVEVNIIVIVICILLVIIAINIIIGSLAKIRNSRRWVWLGWCFGSWLLLLLLRGRGGYGRGSCRGRGCRRRSRRVRS